MDPRTALRGLETILPSDVDTLLLRACLRPRDHGVESWNAWCAQVGDPKRAFERDRRGLKGLLSLAEASARASRAALPSEFSTYLRVSSLREELRADIIRGVYTETIEVLRAVGIAPITLRDFAIAETVYAAPAERHCHRLELLVSEDELSATRSALSTVGFTPIVAGDDQDCDLRHPTGLPLRLHRTIGVPPCYLPSQPEIRARAEESVIAGASSRVLSAADQVLDSTIHGATDASRSDLRWICDLWHLVNAGDAVDWDSLLDAASEGALTLPLTVVLDYLATRLGAPIPDAVLVELRHRAARLDPVQVEAAVFAAVDGIRTASRALLGRSSTLRERLSLARALALPSRDWLELSGQAHRGAKLPLFYLQRPVRYVVSRSRARAVELLSETAER
jgi:hypothetical protein